MALLGLKGLRRVVFDVLLSFFLFLEILMFKRFVDFSGGLFFPKSSANLPRLGKVSVVGVERGF